MDIKEELTKIKDVVKELVLKFSAEPTAELKFGTVNTTDGKALSFEGEMLAEGSAVTIDGAPAPDGDYELETGVTVTIAAGVVSALADGAAPKDTNQTPANDFEAQFAEMQTTFEAKFSAINDQIKTLSDSLTQIAEQFGKGMDVVEKFAAQAPAPEAAPTNKKPTLHETQSNRLAGFKKTLTN